MSTSEFGSILAAGGNHGNGSAITSNDVLLGRGGATNNHVGNKRFRIIVAQHQDEYLKAKKKEKANIAKIIVKQIQANGGRFLRRDDSGMAWVTVPDKRAQEKTSQALREGLDVRHKRFRPERMPKTTATTTSSSTDQHQHKRARGETKTTVKMVSPELSSMPHPSSADIMPDLAQEMAMHGASTSDECLFLYLPAQVIASEDVQDRADV
jgi:hypothetical protein